MQVLPVWLLLIYSIELPDCLLEAEPQVLGTSTIPNLPVVLLPVPGCYIPLYSKVHYIVNGYG